MGQVYDAVEQKSGRRVAIKILHASHRSDGEILARFRAEADALRIVSHPGIVELYEEGELPSGELFIVMELLNGQTLHRLLQEGQLAIERSLAIVAELATVLSKVHSHKIVHRDLKPENIMLLGSSINRPLVKVLDFGIAKLSAVTAPRTQIHTRTGVFFGTPAYMAPEQCGGEGEICDRTDVYAAGVVLYEMLAGRPPFVGETEHQLIGQQLFQLPPPLRSLNQKVPADVELLVHSMLAKRPKQRPSMRTVAAIVAALARGERLSEIHITALRLLRETETVRYGAEQPVRRQRSVRKRWFVGGGVCLSLIFACVLVGFSASKSPSSSVSIASPPRSDDAVHSTTQVNAAAPIGLISPMAPMVRVDRPASPAKQKPTTGFARSAGSVKKRLDKPHKGPVGSGKIPIPIYQ